MGNKKLVKGLQGDNPQYDPEKDKVKKVLENNSEGLTQEQVRKETGMSHQKVGNRLRELVNEGEAEVVKREGRKGFLYLNKNNGEDE